MTELILENRTPLLIMAIVLFGIGVYYQYTSMRFLSDKSRPIAKAILKDKIVYIFIAVVIFSISFLSSPFKYIITFLCVFGIHMYLYIRLKRSEMPKPFLVQYNKSAVFFLVALAMVLIWLQSFVGVT